jgi:hypothetical protein
VITITIILQEIVIRYETTTTMGNNWLAVPEQKIYIRLVKMINLKRNNQYLKEVTQLVLMGNVRQRIYILAICLHPQLKKCGHFS